MSNHCCQHAGCRPSTSDAAAQHPHHCTVRRQDDCPAYVPYVGCLSLVERIARMNLGQLDDIITGRVRYPEGSDEITQQLAWNLAIDEETRRTA